ncbi:TrkH family potassium uptake protein [Natronohydrobacter thiooxidans]|uniref:TrkH family potassium uptake protein n=1 Tax=Natronohydrobacter thiooxidans TaxID=87172 RepID=UPI0008FF48AF|nr:TrkH family potassium uptake protein [Natronohydrobacter thiooxidans]
MLNLRPVFHLIGLLSLTLGVLMLIPAALDWRSGNDNWHAFARASFLVCLIGGVAAMATRQALADGLGRRQSFLLTASVWAVLPALGALPFIFGAPHASPTHALFEALSGMTTTGTTVFTGLDDLPPGVLLWRSMLQWLGGLGIIIVALVFLPVLRVGGMQHFQAEAFDTMGKVLPRVYDISMGLLQVYIGLTLAAIMSYMAYGMNGFDAINHAMTTIATGGFSTSDQSFAKFTGPLEYVSALYMILAGLPFIRFVQLVGGSWTPLLRDVQVRAFLRWSAYAVLVIIVYRLMNSDDHPLDVLRGTLFNVVTLITGTGYGSEAVDGWGDFPLLVIVLMGFIGACTASTGCSLKVFRYLVLFEAIRAQMQRLRRPHEVVSLKLGGKRLEEDVISSVIVMFTVFIASFMLLSVGLSLTGLGLRASMTAAWTSICNIGPVFGPEVGATGAVDSFPEAAKWLMMLGMYLGRLEVLAVMVLLLPRFWRG